MNYLKIGSIVILIVLIAWGEAALWNAGKKDGADSVQVLWDKDRAEIQDKADAAIAAATKQKEDAIAANEVIANDYQAQLLAARTLSSQLAQRLRLAETRPTTGSGAVSKDPTVFGVIVPSGTPSMGQIDDAIAATLTECASNRSQLNSLIAEIRPQL